ncbi:hypothetical protein [Nocardioides sp.]|uniref:hypothetical protein n=1 Tax=Nocardioides sp. TaxID=35761 RepID=UPI0035134E46
MSRPESRPAATRLPRALRRVAALVATLPALVVVGLLTAQPASASSLPEGWETQEGVSPAYAFGIVLGIPLLLALVIAVLVYAPAVARGESVRPGAQQPEPQWLGGPRREINELAAPDSEGSAAGGASGSW